MIEVVIRDVKLEFFQNRNSKKSIKTLNSFPVCTGRVAVAEHPVAWWVDCGGPRAMAVSRRRRGEERQTCRPDC